jgi:hypothetical protein
MCGISTQLARIALLESAQLKSSVFVLASMVVQRGCVVQRAGQGDQKGFGRCEGGLVFIGAGAWPAKPAVLA